MFSGECSFESRDLCVLAYGSVTNTQATRDFTDSLLLPVPPFSKKKKERSPKARDFTRNSLELEYLYHYHKKARTTRKLQACGLEFPFHVHLHMLEHQHLAVEDAFREKLTSDNIYDYHYKITFRLVRHAFTINASWIDQIPSIRH